MRQCLAWSLVSAQLHLQVIQNPETPQASVNLAVNGILPQYKAVCAAAEAYKKVRSTPLVGTEMDEVLCDHPRIEAVSLSGMQLACWRGTAALNLADRCQHCQDDAGVCLHLTSMH